MRRREYFDQVQSGLSRVYPTEEARVIAFILFETYMSFKREDIFLDPDAEIEPLPAIADALEQLWNNRPLQYVLGNAEFCGLNFEVDGHVLIPRPETEELVQWICKEWRGKSPQILDVGTGSGAIAVALAKNLPEAVVSALDISAEAIRIAAANAARHGVKVSFVVEDIIRHEPEGKYDIIVSNPPYVRQLEKKYMRKNVLDYEPQAALFVPDDDPLLFYRRIAELGRTGLKENGALYFEINEAFGRHVADLMADLGYRNMEIRKDIFGKDRMVKGVFS